MKKTEKIVLDLLARTLFGVDVTLPEDVDWETLYKESKMQTISLLIYDGLTQAERESIPATLNNLWMENVTQDVWLNEKILAEQQAVVQLLQEHQIPCVILKGSSSAINYPCPYLRAVGDIDLLVKPEQQMKAACLLESVGYGNAAGESGHIHVAVSKEYITVELHKEPNGIDIIEDKLLAQRIRDFFEDATATCQCEDGLPVLLEEQQVLVLLLHKLGHFLNDELGLRQLCDWAVFVDQRLSKELWTKVEPVLREFGLLQFAGYITRTCIDYLGLPSEKALWAMQYDAETASEIIERIVQSGNFGRKENTYGQRLFVDIYSPNRWTSFWKVLISSCKTHWPICKKYPLLMPVAPFVLYGQYLKRRITGERPKLKVVSLYNNADSKQKLYHKLQPFVVDKSDQLLDMSTEIELIFLIRGVLHNQKHIVSSAEVTKEKAEFMMQYAFKQGLSMFLNEYSMFQEIIQEDGKLRKILVEFYQHVLLQEELKTIIAAFEENQISCVLLKGVQTCKYYPKPELRSMGDIDLLYLPEQTKKVQKVMEGLGYSYEGNTAKHDHYRNKRVVVEMHKTLCVPNWQESEYFKDIWNRVVNKDGYQYIFEMSLEDHYLFTFTHLLEHFQDGGIGIRMVLDIYVLSQIDDINWNYINDVIEELGYTQFHSNIRRLAVRWFDENVDRDMPNNLSELEQYIMRGGIFGNSKNSETNVQIQYKNRVQFLAKVICPNYESMQTVYPWLKSKILLPIAWVCRWAQAATSRQENVKSQFGRFQTFGRDKQELEIRKRFFESIGLYKK